MLTQFLQCLPNMAPTLAETAGSIPAYHPNDLALHSAQAFLTARLQALHGVETAALLQAAGRVLGESVSSSIDLPPDHLAAMDGYALCSRGAAAQGQPSPVHGSSLAGHPWTGPVDDSTCLRITTGAIVPEGLDCVVPHELTRYDGATMTVLAAPLRAGSHVRQRGEDLRRGDTAIAAGTVLHAAHIGLAASLGLGQLTVRRGLRVAYFSTGDELLAPGSGNVSGSGIFDSNRYTLGALLRRLSFVEATDLGRLPDEPIALTHALRRACQSADVVLSTGGVSQGSADHTRTAMADCADMVFWQLAVKPGRPFAFGQTPGGTALFGLPGNPVAMIALYCALVRPALYQLAGASDAGGHQPLALQAICTQPHAKRPGRTEFLRAQLGVNEQGQCTVAIDPNQSSGNLCGFSRAQALVVLPQEQGQVAAGSTVTVWPLQSLL